MHKKFHHRTMSNFSILIVENDLVFALELDMLIRKIGYSVKERVDNYTEALAIIATDTPDLVLLNLDISESNAGLAVVKQLKDLAIPVVALVGFTNKKIYESASVTNFVGYLTKPVSTFSIRTTINSTVQYQRKKSGVSQSSADAFTNDSFFFFKKKNIYQKIAIAAILYIQADGDTTKIVTKDNNSYSSPIRLLEMEQCLVPHGFLKVHRSYLAHLQNATSVDVENQLISFGGVRIPFSRRRKGVVLGKVSVV